MFEHRGHLTPAVALSLHCVFCQRYCFFTSELKPTSIVLTLTIKATQRTRGPTVDSKVSLVETC